MNFVKRSLVEEGIKDRVGGSGGVEALIEDFLPPILDLCTES